MKHTVQVPGYLVLVRLYYVLRYSSTTLVATVVKATSYSSARYRLQVLVLYGHYKHTTSRTRNWQVLGNQQRPMPHGTIQIIKALLKRIATSQAIRCQKDSDRFNRIGLHPRAVKEDIDLSNILLFSQTRESNFPGEHRFLLSSAFRDHPTPAGQECH